MGRARLCCFVLLVAGCSDPSSDEAIAKRSGKMLLDPEIEPNGAIAQATPIGTRAAVIGNVAPNGDADYFSFTGATGERVYAATQTGPSSSGSSDSVLSLLASDGTTVIESDDDNGSLAPSSSSIAGAVLPATGTFYLRVTHYSATGQLRPYHLHFQKRTGSPSAEVEPNDVTPQSLGAGFIAGSLTSATDSDLYSIDLNAGDTLFASLDLDPDRNGTQFDGTLALGPFPSTILLFDDAGGPGADSEAALVTVRASGTYHVRVASASGFGAYQLNVSVHPAESAAACTTYTTSAPVTIPSGPGTVTSTLNVPDDFLIGDVDVSIELSHTFPGDLDVHLASPAGSDSGLFTDVGSDAFPSLSLSVDDEAAYPVNAFPVLNGVRVQPESAYRLSWFDGERAQGTWTLQLSDDEAGDGGTLSSWGLKLCRAGEALSCVSGSSPTAIFATDFEASDAGFTHSGTADEWARGTPSAVPITTCNSGVTCFKTDLTGTYNASSNQNLISPSINLAGRIPPLHVRWAHKLQMESASFDHAWVEIRNVGGANPRRIFEFLDGTMTDGVGSPTTTIQESAGWGIHEVDISEYAGSSVELVFHVDSNATNQYSGLAIDDVSVMGCSTGGGGAGGAGGAGAGGAGGAGAGGAGAGGAGAGGAGAGGVGGPAGGMGGVAGASGAAGVAGGGVGGRAGASGAGGAAGTAAGGGGVSGAGGSGPMGGVSGTAGTSAGEGGAAAGEGGEAGETGGGGEAGAPATGGTAGSGGGTSGGTTTGGAAGSTAGAMAAGAAGEAGKSAKSGGADEESGCGCRIPGTRERPLGSWGLVALALGALCVRRRRASSQ
jgi:subtilisin-like proprotein convertase family protein